MQNVLLSVVFIYLLIGLINLIITFRKIQKDPTFFWNLRRNTNSQLLPLSVIKIIFYIVVILFWWADD